LPFTPAQSAGAGEQGECGFSQWGCPVCPAPGTIIGKALGTLASGTGVVKMLVMLR